MDKVLAQGGAGPGAAPASQIGAKMAVPSQAALLVRSGHFWPAAGSGT